MVPNTYERSLCFYDLFYEDPRDNIKTYPVCSPGVPAHPVLLPSVLVSAPPNNGNLVVDGWVFQLLSEHSTQIFVKLLRSIHPTPDGSSLPYLLLHVLRTLHIAVFLSVVSRLSRKKRIKNKRKSENQKNLGNSFFAQQLGLSPGLGGGQVQSLHRLMSGLLQSSTGPPSTAS